MKYEISVKKMLAANIKNAWDVVSTGSGVELWFPEMIKSCDYNADTNVRLCAMTNGEKLTEKILLINDEKYIFRYAITNHPLNAANLISTIRMKEEGDQTLITWEAEFDSQENAAAEVKEALKHIYQAGCDALESYLKQSSKMESGHV